MSVQVNNRWEIKSPSTSGGEFSDPKNLFVAPDIASGSRASLQHYDDVTGKH